jgi:hypothetical protein
MKAYGGVGVYIHVFLTSALVGGEWSASRPGRFTPGERAPGTHWIGGWVDPRAGLDDVEKRKILTLPGLELRPLGRPASRQSLYRLLYPGSDDTICTFLLPKDSKCRMKRKNNGQFEMNIMRQKGELSRDWHTSGKRIGIFQLKWTNICFHLYA